MPTISPAFVKLPSVYMALNTTSKFKSRLLSFIFEIIIQQVYIINTIYIIKVITLMLPNSWGKS